MKKLILILTLAAIAPIHADTLIYTIRSGTANTPKERSVTLTPGTTLRVSGSSTLEPVADAEFVSALGLVTSSTAVQYIGSGTATIPVTSGSSVVLMPTGTATNIGLTLRAKGVGSLLLSDFAGVTSINASSRRLFDGLGTERFEWDSGTFSGDFVFQSGSVDFEDGLTAFSLALTTPLDGAYMAYSSTTAPGAVTLATDAEIQTGSNTGKAVRVSGLSAWWTWVKTQAQTIAGTWSFSGTTTANVVSATTANVTTGTVGTLTVAGNSTQGDSAADEFTATDDDPRFPNLTASSYDSAADDTVAINGSVGDDRYARLAATTGRSFYLSTFSGWTANVSGGSVTQGALSLAVRSNAGAGNRAAACLGVFNLSAGTSARGWPWGKAVDITVWFSLNGDSRSTVRMFFGETAAYTSGPLATRGLGFSVSGTTLTTYAHNGTSLTTHGTTTVVTTGNNWISNLGYVLRVTSDGAGNVSYKMNGATITGGVGGPTSVNSNSEAIVVCSENHAASAAVSDLILHSIFYKNRP